MSFEFGVLNFGVLLIAAMQFMRDSGGVDDTFGSLLVLGALACLLWGAINGLYHIGAFSSLITFLGFPARP